MICVGQRQQSIVARPTDRHYHPPFALSRRHAALCGHYARIYARIYAHVPGRCVPLSRSCDLDLCFVPPCEGMLPDDLHTAFMCLCHSFRLRFGASRANQLLLATQHVCTAL